MKRRNKRLIQILVMLVIIFFFLSTVGLSLLSITYVNAPGQENPAASVDVDTTTPSEAISSGSAVSGEVAEQ